MSEQTLKEKLNSLAKSVLEEELLKAVTHFSNTLYEMAGQGYFSMELDPCDRFLSEKLKYAKDNNLEYKFNGKHTVSWQK